MPKAALFAIDLVAILVLMFTVYFPRHRRRDMLLAYIGLNVGVMVVTLALSGSTVDTGLGLGLFGVLSIIRLRSSELTQEEVAYYFISLAMGLLCGVQIEPQWLTPTLIATMIAVVFVIDHPRLLDRQRRVTLTMDSAFLDEREMIDRLEQMLGATVQRAVVNSIDLVRDTTTVDVRFRLDPARRGVTTEELRRGLAASSADYSPA